MAEQQSVHFNLAITPEVRERLRNARLLWVKPDLAALQALSSVVNVALPSNFYDESSAVVLRNGERDRESPQWVATSDGKLHPLNEEGPQFAGKHSFVVEAPRVWRRKELVMAFGHGLLGMHGRRAAREAWEGISSPIPEGALPLARGLIGLAKVAFTRPGLQTLTTHTELRSPLRFTAEHTD